ncbi:SsgA family sporulation/cell division regulator [Streptomyces flaveolus]|uniref:SsgA family sporulation/cell division regulator n=1 Tax=Streptomyces flaveolus TaxID=67297 RepID=UPI0033E2DC70
MAEDQVNACTDGVSRPQVDLLRLRARWLVGQSPPVPIYITFQFDQLRPFTVATTFEPDGRPPVTWHISRELLHDGLVQRSGSEDVYLWPWWTGASWVLCIRLCQQRKTALFEVDLEAVEHWLSDTYDVVPAAEELNGIDWEALVAHLLG